MSELQDTISFALLKCCVSQWPSKNSGKFLFISNISTVVQCACSHFNVNDLTLQCPVTRIMMSVMSFLFVFNRELVRFLDILAPSRFGISKHLVPVHAMLLQLRGGAVMVILNSIDCYRFRPGIYPISQLTNVYISILWNHFWFGNLVFYCLESSLAINIDSDCLTLHWNLSANLVLVFELWLIFPPEKHCNYWAICMTF